MQKKQIFRSYYYVKIMNVSNDEKGNEYKADAPAFSVESRDIVNATAQKDKQKPSALNVFSNQYAANSSDGAISVTFTTNNAVTGSCLVEYMALTDVDQKTIITKKIKEEYKSFYSIDDVKISDGDGNEIILEDDSNKKLEFSEDQMYNMGTTDRFYDFDGNLFVYDEEDNRFYNENDCNDYFITMATKI